MTTRTFEAGSQLTTDVGAELLPGEHPQHDTGAPGGGQHAGDATLLRGEFGRRAPRADRRRSATDRNYGRWRLVPHGRAPPRLCANEGDDRRGAGPAA